MAIKLPATLTNIGLPNERQASSIQEISYRACFKPQLPRFFINLLTKPDDVVYDPFGGRGTTAIEAALMGRNCISNDINPLSEILLCPRLELPELSNIEERLNSISKLDFPLELCDLAIFYEGLTELEIRRLRNYLAMRRKEGSEDSVDRWIRMVATNRLTGHSSGFFSVYSLPPNQAVSKESQKRINEKLGLKPEYRNVHELIRYKSYDLIRNLTSDDKISLQSSARTATFLCQDARFTREITSDSVDLTVTSPPFLNIVQYSQDNWLRCWFNYIDVNSVAERITMSKSVKEWEGIMQDVFCELFRITKVGGYVAFEVGEIKNGGLELDLKVVPLGLNAGFRCIAVVVNTQEFTKTSNIWGINNNRKGTNSNRIVLFQKVD